MAEGGKSSLNLIKLFIQGGWVMYPILALQVASFTITIERIIIIMIQTLRLKPGKFLDLFEERLQKNNYDKLKTIEELTPMLQKKKTACAEVILTVFRKYTDGTQKRLNPIEIREWMSKAAESKAVIEIPALEAHLGALAVISNVATLMGLFGTVIGMIESFAAMANSPGGVKPDEMAGGIAVALVATAGGLCVAVPALLLYNWIKSIVEGFVLQIDETVQTLIDQLAE